MTRALALSQRQVRALCAGAKKEGYAPIVQIGNAFVHLVPEDRVIRPQGGKVVDEDEDDAGTSLEKWRKARDAGKAYGRP